MPYEKFSSEKMATGPKILTDPIELLTPDLSRPEPFINPFYAPGVCAVLGFAGVCFGNFAIRRPVFSGNNNLTITENYVIVLPPLKPFNTTQRLQQLAFLLANMLMYIEAIT